MKQHILLPLFTVFASAALAAPTANTNKPSITRQPASLTVDPGGIAVFSATATNVATYQWTLGGRPLVDGGNVRGSYSNVLTINPVATVDAGSYQLTSYNPYGTGASSVVKLTVPLETAKPVVTIIKPAIGARSNSFTFSGTVSDRVRVAGVSYVINNLNTLGHFSGQATLSSGTGSSNWTFQPPIMFPGTNILLVTGSNYSGKTSTATRAFFFRLAVPVTLEPNIAGYGTISGRASFAGDPAPSNGVNLYIGEGYTVTATPASDTLFAFWVTNNIIGPTNRTFSFIMENGERVLAVFMTNKFLAMAGRYDGIFTGTGETNSGLIGNLKIGTNGVYSGSLYLAGDTYSLQGAFDASGQATETVARPNASGSNVTLMLNMLAGSSPRTIIASVMSQGWQVDNFMLVAAQTNTQSVSYTMVFGPANAAVPGFGYALITNKNGVLSLGGALADGSAFTQSTALAEDGMFPVYARLYNGGGLLLGRGSPSNGMLFPVQWIKPPAKSGAGSNGFDAVTAARGSVWSQGLGSYTNIVAKDPYLVISGPGLSNNLDARLALPKPIVNGEGTNLSVFGINPANGMLSVVFTNNFHVRVTGFGALMQNENFGGGYYLGATNDGAFRLLTGS